MADEALRSITDLLERIPGWKLGLEDILQAVTARQKERLREDQPATPMKLFRKPSKSSSLLSKPSTAEGHVHWGDTSRGQARREDDILRSQLPHMTPSDALRLAQRKRKTASAGSDLSGRPRFRSRGAVVVYYDGDVQKQFEEMVRAIAANRNVLRKGKLLARVDQLSWAGSGSNSEESSSSREQTPLPLAKLAYVTTRSVPNTSAGKDRTTEAFVQLDGLLEQVQALCEQAAHQVLRDGDSAVEMGKAKEHVVELQKIAEVEKRNLEQRTLKMQGRQERKLEVQKAEQADLEIARHRCTPVNDREKIENPFSSPDSLEVDLEADDSDDGEDFGFEVGALQLDKFGIRCTRSPALGAV